jgi:SAM-dependent methyltransferase
MNLDLLHIVNRQSPPVPWGEGENIPWNEPAFSERMLREHLSQEHDAASRRATIIDAHVAWIHQEVLDGRVGRVLDLGCGPGLYASRLARRGHTCVGIDWGPASIAHARRTAADEGLSCRYLLEDIRAADYGVGYDLAMLIFGEFNVFQPADARLLLTKMVAALRPGGQALIEYQTEESVRRLASVGPSWYSSASGLFYDLPHLCLEERFWDEASATGTTRFYIVDAATGDVVAHVLTAQAYTQPQLEAVLRQAGLADARWTPSLTGAPTGDGDFSVVVARKP